jgi:hypothetical protein
MDWCLRAYEKSTNSGPGMTGGEADGIWFGFADDIGDVAKTERAAQARLHQLQGSTRWGGWLMNIIKTECMAVATGNTTLRAGDAEVQKVKIDGRNALTVEWRGAKNVPGAENYVDHADLTKLEEATGAKRPSHLIVWEDEGGEPNLNQGSPPPTPMDVDEEFVGNMIADEDKYNHAVQRGKGWFLMRDGVTKLRKADREPARTVIAARNAICNVCGQQLHGVQSLEMHKRVGWCRANMTPEEMQTVARARRANAKKYFDQPEDEGAMELRDLRGNKIKHTSSFKYLGTLLKSNGSSKHEILKRVAMGRNAVNQLKPIWNTRILREKTKRAVYKVMCLAVILYNIEVLSLNEADQRRLGRFQYEALKTVTRKKRMAQIVANGGIDRISIKKVHALVEINEMKDIISERRLKFIGHLMRDDEEGVKEDYEKSKNNPECRWFKHVRADRVRFGFRSIAQMEEMALDKNKWNRYLGNKMLELVPKLDPVEVEQQDVDVEDNDSYVSEE